MVSCTHAHVVRARNFSDVKVQEREYIIKTRNISQ